MTPSTQEELARLNIDKQLEACGWMVQDRDKADIHATRGVAFREFPLEGGGAVDYMLYAGSKPYLPRHRLIVVGRTGTTTAIERASTKEGDAES